MKHLFLTECNHLFFLTGSLTPVIFNYVSKIDFPENCFRNDEEEFLGEIHQLE